MIKHNKTKFEETYFYIIPSDWIKEGFIQKNLRHFFKDWCFDILKDEVKTNIKKIRPRQKWNCLLQILCKCCLTSSSTKRKDNRMNALLIVKSVSYKFK